MSQTRSDVAKMLFDTASCHVLQLLIEAMGNYPSLFLCRSSHILTTRPTAGQVGACTKKSQKAELAKEFDTFISRLLLWKE
jgi:hypothetical protein